MSTHVKKTSRRDTLKTLTAGGLAGTKLATARWVPPVVAAVSLPAHAHGTAPIMCRIGRSAEALATISAYGDCNASPDIGSINAVVNPPLEDVPVTMSVSFLNTQAGFSTNAVPAQTQTTDADGSVQFTNINACDFVDSNTPLATQTATVRLSFEVHDASAECDTSVDLVMAE